MSSSPVLGALLLAASTALVGCRTSEATPDARRELVESVSLEGVLLLGGLAGGVGSGLALDADHLLTAWHVVDAMTDGCAPFSLRVGEHVARAEVVARDVARDWAVLRVERPSWRAADAVVLHARAGGRAPSPGRELWFAGYPAKMFPPDGVPADSRAKRLRAVEAEPVGRFLAAKGPTDDLQGMSGGGVFAWSRTARRLELVGVFLAQSETVRGLELPFGLLLPVAIERRLLFEPVPGAVLELARRDVP